MAKRSNRTMRGAFNACICAVLATALVVATMFSATGLPNAYADGPSDDVNASMGLSKAATLPVTDSALHTRSSDPRYHNATLLYETLALSGSGFGKEILLMTHELESLSSPAVYEQSYSFVDGSSHRYTGLPLAELLVQEGASVTDSTAVRIESADGSAYMTNVAELCSATAGTMGASGLPALLFFGCDGAPNADGAMSVVLGEGFADPQKATIDHVTRIAVGQDIDYAQHVYAPYDQSRYVGGAKDVVVRIYRGSKLASETSFSYLDIEAMARADRAGIQRGRYSTLIYKDDETTYSGPLTDCYEGYDLYKVLQAAGAPSNQPDAKVQFYQTGDHGLSNSWKTVSVSLGYLAGNGPAGVGDYSQNMNRYGREEGVSTGGEPVMGVRPMIAYGKNGLPLMFTKGSPGVKDEAFNYRGPLVALLPENAAEGGRYVGEDTVTTCFLGLIDVYLDSDAPLQAAPMTTQDKTVGALLSTSDWVAEGQTVRTRVITPSDGTVHVTSSDPEVATAAYDPATKELSVTATGVGSCTVSVKADASDGFLASEVHEVPVCVMEEEFLGGSLRTDQFKPDGTPEDSVASLRLGYRIGAPTGIEGMSWHWSFGQNDDPDGSGSICQGSNYLRDPDGSITTNIVFTSIAADSFETPMFARLVIAGEDAYGNMFAWSDGVRSRSVQQVASAAFGQATGPVDPLLR